MVYESLVYNNYCDIQCNSFVGSFEFEIEQYQFAIYRLHWHAYYYWICSLDIDYNNFPNIFKNY